MKRRIIVCGVLAVVIGGSSSTAAQKGPKCVNPTLVFTVTDSTPGLRADGSGTATYVDGLDGIYAQMEHCGGSGDVVLRLDTTRRQTYETLSDGGHIVGRLDITGVEYVAARCALNESANQAVTLWHETGFLKVNGNNGSDMARVCRNDDGSWTVTSTSTASAARFEFFHGHYRYTGTNEFVPFQVTVRYK
jgi:hypothetical protein